MSLRIAAAFAVAALAPACTCTGTASPPATPAALAAPAYYTDAPNGGRQYTPAPAELEPAPPQNNTATPLTPLTPLTVATPYEPGVALHAREPRSVPHEPRSTTAEVVVVPVAGTSAATPTPVAVRPAPIVVAQPTPVAVRPAPIVVTQPTPVAVRPTPISVAQPTPVAVRPAPIVVAQPTPVAVRPTPIVVTQPTPVAVRPSRPTEPDVDIERPLPRSPTPARAPVTARAPAPRDNIQRTVPASPARNVAIAQPSRTTTATPRSPSRNADMAHPHAQPVALRRVAVHPVVLRPAPTLDRATSAENL